MDAEVPFSARGCILSGKQPGGDECHLCGVDWPVGRLGVLPPGCPGLGGRRGGPPRPRGRPPLRLRLARQGARRHRRRRRDAGRLLLRPRQSAGLSDRRRRDREVPLGRLALVRRGDRGYLNEPHANGGSPILSSGGGVLFNDLLGSTLGTLGGEGYRPVSLTAFGDTDDAGAFFTGKPKVDGLGYAFLLRSYRPDHGKWLTADPLGYPDGWNQMAYCGNDGISAYDSLGGKSIGVHGILPHPRRAITIS